MRTFMNFRQSRRGAAMLLVIISLMMATILTTAYLSSRDNSGLIGMNASRGASARAAALSGLDMAAAMMQTQTNWRTADVAGMLLNNAPVGGGTVSVRATDELTKLAPTATSEYLSLSSTGMVDGVDETATARVYAPVGGGNTVDVDLSDFAVFAGTRLDMANRGTITRWSKSPLFAIPSRVSVGTCATSAASIVMSDTSGAIDGSVYVPPGSSSSLVVTASGPAVQNMALKDTIPMPAAPNVGLAAAVAIPVPVDAVVNGGTSTIIANARYRILEIKNNGIRTFQGNLRIVTERDLKINSGGKLAINGNVKLAVFGDLIMDLGAIELSPTSTLSLYVRGSGAVTSVNLRDSYIGDARTDKIRDNTGAAKYFNPAQIAIFSMPPIATAANWLIERNTVVKGSMYCPDAAKVTIQDQSALYGRIATKAMAMSGDAAIFYDPRLNSRNGYATTTSPLYNKDGTIVSAYKNLISLDTSSLQAAADLSGKTVRGITYGSTDVTPASALPVAPPPADGSGITPRPERITYELLTLSNNVRDWETGVNNAGAVTVATTADLSATVAVK